MLKHIKLYAGTEHCGESVSRGAHHREFGDAFNLTRSNAKASLYSCRADGNPKQYTIEEARVRAQLQKYEPKKRQTSGRGMAQPDTRVTIRSVRTQAEAVANACAAIERPPADIKVVAEMSAVAREISRLFGREMQSESLGRRAEVETHGCLVQCERSLQSLGTKVAAVAANARRADRTGAGEDAAELRSRAVAEQQLLRQIYEAFASLGQSRSIDAEGDLRRLEEGMESLSQLAGETKGKFNSSGSGEQNNYVNESTGMQNVNRRVDSHAPVYFGQNISFRRDE